MIFDVDAVKQLVRQYNGFYLVKGGSGGGVLQYKSDAHCCSIHVDCGSGEVRVTLQEEYRGKQSVAKKFPDYNSIHEIFTDPKLVFMDEVVKKPKRREVQDDEPLKFSISAFKDPTRPSIPSKRPTFKPLGMLDLGGDLGSDLGSLGPPVPSLGPKKELTRVEKERLREEERERQRQRGKEAEEGEDGEGSGGGSPVKKPVSHQDLLAMDYLYKTKTKSELNFLKRQIDREYDESEKRAKLSHKQNIEKYNSYLAAIPEQNDMKRINSCKH